jgi:hypothetical protein
LKFFCGFYCSHVIAHTMPQCWGASRHTYEWICQCKSSQSRIRFLSKSELPNLNLSKWTKMTHCQMASSRTDISLNSSYQNWPNNI